MSAEDKSGSMLIGEMNSHCGDCDLIDYCGDPWDEPYLCQDPRFENVDVEIYLKYAEKSRGRSKVAVANDVYRKLKTEAGT